MTAGVLADGSFAIEGTEISQPTPQELTVRLQARFFAGGDQVEEAEDLLGEEVGEGGEADCTSVCA